MTEYSDLDLEVIASMKKECIFDSKASALDDLYYFIIEHKHGKGARDPMLAVDWDLVFKENQCPECRGIISLRELTYVCDECSLRIPLKMYDLASEEYFTGEKIHDEALALDERMVKAGYTEKRIDELYDEAENQAYKEVEAMERKTEEAGIKTRPGAKLSHSARRGGGES